MKLLLACPSAALLLAVAALAGEPPTRRAGEWQITIIQKDGSEAAPEHFCYRAASFPDITKRMGTCSKRDIRTVGNTTTIDAICTKDNRQATLHMTITAPSDTAYHADMHITYSPPIDGTTDVDMVQDAKWLGPCPPGEMPVD